MFRVIDHEERQRILDEALKGERGINEISAAEGVSRDAIRDWLKEHYELFPDDPRRHLVLRESERYARQPEQQTLELTSPADDGYDDVDEGEGAEGEGADNAAAREDMAAKKHRGGKDGPHPKKEQILKEYDEAEGARGVQAALSNKYNVSTATISGWIRQREIEKSRADKLASRKEAVLADIKAGYSGTTLVARHKGKASKSTIYGWLAEYRAATDRQTEARRQNAAKAREAKAEKLQDPEYREQQRRNNWRNLPEAEATLVSPPSASAPSTALVPLSTRLPVVDMPADSRILGDSLAECIEERTTLRGMVALLNRENEQLKRDLRHYQRTYGEIRQ